MDERGELSRGRHVNIEGLESDGSLGRMKRDERIESYGEG